MIRTLQKSVALNIGALGSYSIKLKTIESTWTTIPSRRPARAKMAIHAGVKQRGSRACTRQISANQALEIEPITAYPELSRSWARGFFVSNQQTRLVYLKTLLKKQDSADLLHRDRTEARRSIFPTDSSGLDYLGVMTQGSQSLPLGLTMTTASQLIPAATGYKSSSILTASLNALQ